MAKRPEKRTRGPRGRPPLGSPPTPSEAREQPGLAWEPTVRVGVEMVAVLWDDE